jgi:guanylate kinase
MMQNKEHVLLCVLGESSSGKDSLVSKLCERTGHTAICSYTTRPRRDGEGETHIFVDDTVYEEMLSEGRIAAYTEISGYRYWTSMDQLYENSYYIIDYDGLKTLKSLNLPNLRLVSAYINVPESIRKERAMKRGDKLDVYRKRCLSEREQFRQMKKDIDVDYVVSNVDFAKAFSVLKWICNVEGLFMNKEDTTE